MNLDDIRTRVAEIGAMKDHERAHSLEDELLKDFVRHVAESGHDPLAAMAAEVLKADEMDFKRWTS